MSERYEVDWRFTAWAAYPGEVDAWKAIVRSNAPGADEAAVFMGGHCAMILSRCATGREGLNLLAAWSRPGLAGFTVEDLVRASMRWHQQAIKKRRDTLRRIAHILRDVEHELGKRANVDPADVAGDAEELRVEIADRLASPADSRPFVGLFGAWAPAGRAVRALRRALQSYRTAWPWRSHSEALNTPRKVQTARAGIAKAVEQ